MTWLAWWTCAKYASSAQSTHYSEYLQDQRDQEQTGEELSRKLGKTRLAWKETSSLNSKECHWSAAQCIRLDTSRFKVQGATLSKVPTTELDYKFTLITYINFIIIINELELDTNSPFSKAHSPSHWSDSTAQTTKTHKTESHDPWKYTKKSTSHLQYTRILKKNKLSTAIWFFWHFVLRFIVWQT